MMDERLREFCAARLPNIGEFWQLLRSASGPDALHRQRLKAPEHDALAELRALREQVHLREPLEQHLEDDPAFQACERSTETMVDAASERQVGALAASDIEAVGILEDGRIAVGRTAKQDDAYSQDRHDDGRG